jgi:hypothetical protein
VTGHARLPDDKSKGETDLDGATLSSISQRDPRGLAIELYHTTNLTVPEIATQTGVSSASVYRYLHREGIAVGRHARDVAAGQAGEDMRRALDDLRELRREITTLVGQVRRLEGLVEALIGLKAHAG